MNFGVAMPRTLRDRTGAPTRHAAADPVKGPTAACRHQKLTERQASVASASLKVFDGRITAAALAGSGW
ncbi:hypothetical protein GCM10010195_20720 [Kitasatospora griseola]|nr:hypothetical protein GCM10010195_20720 [Kitasatospora griseola]